MDGSNNMERSYNIDGSNNIAYITCFFGTNPQRIYHWNKNNGDVYFFTNYSNLKNELISKGWNYVYVNKPLSNDLLISSLQSKYVKFLKFLDHYNQFEKYKSIVYFDQKYTLDFKTTIDVENVISKYNSKSCIIFQCNFAKNLLKHEVGRSLKQGRYKKNMSLTEKYIRNNVENGLSNRQIPIQLTGFIIYNMDKILCNDFSIHTKVYDLCMKHQQPQCQIYWSILAYAAKDNIIAIPRNRNFFPNLKHKNKPI